MVAKTRVIGDGGINWDWYLCGDFDDEEKTVHIYYHDRWHKYENQGDSNHPANAEWTTRMTLLEDGKREVYGVRLEQTEYLVTNPGYVFGYKDMSKFVPEA